MVLCLKNLRENVEQFPVLAGRMKEISDALGVKYKNYEQVVASGRENLVELNRLLDAGITELPVPEKLGGGGKPSSLKNGEGEN